MIASFVGYCRFQLLLPLTVFIYFLLTLHNVRAADPSDTCRDSDTNCRDWISGDMGLCAKTEYIMRSCKKSCGKCGSLPPQYDIRRLPANLQPIAFLLGKWRSEHGGKAVFPTIPKFTYGEQLDFSITDEHQRGLRGLNYTAFAWGINDHDELHSEYGYVVVRPGTNMVALTTVMNNGFVTVEEGTSENGRIRLILKDIGRISFSRDLPVHNLIREWTLLDANTLQARLNMETLTHGMQEHTFIRYKKMPPY